MPCSWKYSVRSSAIRLVSVVTRTRNPCGRNDANFIQQIINLRFHRANFDLRINQALSGE